MAISVTQLVQAANGSFSASTLALTTTADCPAGSCILVAASVDANGALSSQGLSGITDSAGNTYVHAVTCSYSSSECVDIWYCKNALHLANGSTITLTMNASQTGNICANASYATGIDKTSPLDQTAALASGQNTSTPSITTGAQSSASGLAFGTWGIFTTVPTITPPSGWSRIGTTITGNTADNDGIDAEYKVYSTNAAITFNPTANTTPHTQIAVATFKAAAQAPGFNMPMLGM